MRRVRWLGFIMLGLGAIEWVAALLTFATSSLAGLYALDERLNASTVGLLVSAYAALFGFGPAVVGAVHVYAGLRVRRGRAYTAAVLGVLACLPSALLTYYTAPLSLIAFAYGLVVLANSESRAALRGSGSETPP